MDIAKQAIEIVQKTERQLLELAGSALSSGEYKSIRVAELAKAVGELVQSAKLNGVDGESAAPNVQAHQEAHADRPEATISRPRRTARRGAYPRFFRSGDYLIKIGWSKKDRSEYQHKAPRQALDALSIEIVSRSANGRLFTIDDLLPLRNRADGNEYPSYQIYVAIAWLKAKGLIKQHGRRGYSAPKDKSLKASIENEWTSLPIA